MKEILYEGPRLRLRKADLTDLDYILRLEYQEENVKYIVPFDKLFHTKVLEGHVEESMDVLAEEIATGERDGGARRLFPHQRPQDGGEGDRVDACRRG